ncbi:MAG: glycine C-acetyltransferase [Clostridiales bacterium]|jgi:glycine C-acetyltransferase|nr:glycine C-acetyltransferase [Clostridiales bacterium]MDN5298728.1 glycine C-acetyltransferase [Clostridiales bacterium]
MMQFSHVLKEAKEANTLENVHELGFLKAQVDALKAQGVFRTLPVLEGANEPEVTLSGKKVINLSSNNYLGFANHPKLKQAAVDAVNKYGVGSGAVRTIIGNMTLHEQLEEKLAAFKREEAVVVFQSGFNCNAGVIQAITEEEDLIVSDSLNHASIIDGVKLSKASKAVFKHSDMTDLEAVLKAKRHLHKQCLIITDGVFSMDGDLAKLPEIVALAEQYNCMTYVDDAHGSGVLGENGRGTVDHFKLHGRVDFSIGTLSKAIGVVGGYVAGRQVMKDWLLHRGRPILFSTSMPPAAVGAIIAAIDELSSTTAYTEKLWDNGNYFKAGLKSLGYDIGHSETPITPVIIGDEAKTVAFSKALYDAGVFVSPIVFPTVPKGTGRVRCMVTAAHETRHLDDAIAAFERVGHDMGII